MRELLPIKSTINLLLFRNESDDRICVVVSHYVELDFRIAFDKMVANHFHNIYRI